ncbi:MAG: hypothetical protein RLZZ435_553 [Cyanobacteriota bacterium]
MRSLILSSILMLCPSPESPGFRLLTLVVDGVSLGSLLALGAVGLTLVYGILRLPNFAQGDLITWGAYLTLVGIQYLHLPWGAAIVLSGVISSALLLLLDRIVWRPLRSQRANSTTFMITSIGLALVLRNLVTLLWGVDNQTYGLPLAEPIPLFCLPILYYRLMILGVVGLVLLGLHYLLQQTRWGKAMRAVADNADLAAVTGINVERIVTYTWIVVGILTAIAGGLYGLVTVVRPSMGWFLILPLFAAVILGGIGNPYGAIVGALAIGISQEVSTYWLDNEYKLVVALAIMLLILLIRPQGLFG